MSGIKVMMFGASRSGKTSILASMYSLRCSVTNYGFTLIDKTDEEKGQETLLDSVIGMKNLLGEKGFTRMGTLRGSQGMFEYTFKLGYSNFPEVPPTYVTFIDVAGESFKSKSPDYEIVCEKAKECQILIVAVDTPALLLAKRKNDYGWDNEINCTDSLIDAIQNLGINCKRDDSGKEPIKMVIFVPIKCERWLHDSGNYTEHMQLIANQIEQVYSDSIEVCKNRERTKVVIMPVETIGGLEFDHHTSPDKMRVLKYDINTRFQNNDVKVEDSAVLEKDDNDECYFTRCEIDEDDNNVVILAKTGKDYQLKEGDTLIDVANLPYYPFCYRENRPIPYAWFKSVGKYAPKNCELLFFEIVQFMVQQVADDINININELLNKKVGDGIWAKIVKFFLGEGYFDDEHQLKAMCQAVSQMKNENRLGVNAIVVHNKVDYKMSNLFIK